MPSSGFVVADSALPMLASLLSEPVVVVDVGARWGFSSVWDELGESCVKIGFEPDPEEYSRLSESFRGSSNMRLAPFALGARPGLSTLYLTKNRGGCSIYPSSEDAVTRHPALDGGLIEGTTIIEMTTLDSWCASEGVDVVDVIKVDTQGSEIGVLRGAEGMLSTVRAVEVEVEFNELYEGVPLFGEVDAYLRSQGFVLWRLRNLAHYSLKGVSEKLRSAETCHYDDYAASFPAGPGQLFWADAYYLKTAVTHPELTGDWETLIRDASITGILGFADLSSLAVERARVLAPQGVRELIEAAISTERRHGQARSRLLATASRLTGAFKLGLGDPEFVGGGWYPPQSLGNARVRWTGPGRDAWVDLPVQVGPGTRVEMMVPAAMTDEIGQSVTMELNRCPVPLDRSPHQSGILYSGTVPASYASPMRFTRLMIRTAPPVPWKPNPSHEDDTELGILVAWIRLTAPGEEEG